MKKNKKYTELDIAAYNLYLKAVEKNTHRRLDSFSTINIGSVDDMFVDHMDKFVEWRSRHYNNMRFYYDNAKIELRKQKLKLLNKKWNIQS